jgi:hypothetical protein
MSLVLEMVAIWLAYQATADNAEFHRERDLEEVVRAHSLPLLTARSASIQGPRWVLGPHFIPVLAVRLVASDVQLVVPERRSRLTGRVLLYCEGNVGNGWAELDLYVAVVAMQMQRAIPFLGHEGPGMNLLEIAPPNRNQAWHNMQTDPIRVLLVYVNAKGTVDRIVTTRIRELDLRSLLAAR